MQRELDAFNSFSYSEEDKDNELLSVPGFNLNLFSFENSPLSKTYQVEEGLFNDCDISQYLSFSCSINQENLLRYEIPQSPLPMTDESLNTLRNNPDNMESQDQQQNGGDQINTDEGMTLGYHKGHVSYLAKTRTPILPQSRKIMKTKKKTNRNQCYYSHVSRFMPNKNKDQAKKYDQKLQQQFEKLSPEEQKIKDVTFVAIRDLIRSNDEESQKILKDHERKYLKNRSKAQFLHLFANELPNSEQK